MKKLMTSLLVINTLYVAPALYGDSSNAYAYQAKQQSVKVPAMRNRVYTQLARAQKLADEGLKIDGFEVLDEVQEKVDSLNSYERAMLWNFYGFMYYGNDDIEMAIDSFKKVVAEIAIPDSLRLSTLYSLAQLMMQQQDYQNALLRLNKWRELQSKDLTGEQHILFAQIYYQDKQYDKSVTAVNNAIALASEADSVPKESWFILQRANYYELKQPKQVTRVMEQLVKHYAKPDYWIQLSNMYGEIGEENKQLAVMEAAWQAGYITQSQDLITLAQLYRFHGVPFKAARVLDDAIAQGLVVATERNLEILAHSYVAAKDDKKALPILQQAAKISSSGKYDAQLAQAYLNLEEWQLAINAADKALSFGQIDRVGDMHLIIGMSYFNLHKFEQSLLAFKAAKNISTSAKTASQWHKYVEREQNLQSQLAQIN